MASSKKLLTKILTGTLALSMIAGTGISAAAVTEAPEEDVMVTDSASNSLKEKIAAYVSEKLSSEKAQQLIENLKAFIAQEFQSEEAQKILAKLQELQKLIPPETLAKIQQIIEIVSQEGFAENMISAYINEFVDTLFKMAQEAMMGAAQAYMSLPEEVRAKIDENLAILQALQAQMKELASMFSVEGDFVYVTEGDFKYSLSLSLKYGVEAAVYEYTGESNKVTVPDTVLGIPVTGVSFNSNAPVLAVTLPATVELIDALCFVGTPTLKYIYVNKDNPKYKSVKGVVYDKEGTTLAAVAPARKLTEIPEGVTNIGSFAFLVNSATTNVTLPSTLTKIEDAAFYGAFALKEVTIPEGVTDIPVNAFLNCSALEKVVIHSTVTSIGENSFMGISPDAVFYCDTAKDCAAKYAIANGYKVSAPLDGEYKTTAGLLLGASAILGAQGIGGSGEYTYSFSYRPAGATSWKALQGYKANNVISFTPTNVGKYDICIKIKDSNGEIVENYSRLTVTQTFNNISSISADEIYSGEFLTVNCKAIAKNSTFAVCYLKPESSSWITAQKYDTNDTVDLKLKKPGNYVICVKAKSKLGYVSKKYFNVTVNE